MLISSQYEKHSLDTNTTLCFAILIDMKTTIMLHLTTIFATLFVAAHAASDFNSVHNEVVPLSIYNKIEVYFRKSPKYRDLSQKDMLELLRDLNDWEAPSFIQKKFAYFLAGYDEESRPIWMAEAGKYNVRGALEKGPEMAGLLEKYALQHFFRVIKSIVEKDTPETPVTEYVFVADLEGFDMHQFMDPKTVDFILKFLKIRQQIMGEGLGAAVLINANYVAELLISLARPIYGQFMEKIEIFGSNKATWMSRLQHLLPADTIPSWYGGRPGFKPLKVYG